jgi:hypothetical protein
MPLELDGSDFSESIVRRNLIDQKLDPRIGECVVTVRSMIDAIIPVGILGLRCSLRV